MKEKTAFLLSSQEYNLPDLFLSLTILLLPTQLGKHFWPAYTSVLGIPIDYLSPTIYVTDLTILGLAVSFCYSKRGQLRTMRFSSRGVLFFFLFLLSLAISTAYASAYFASLYMMGKVIEMAFFGWYIARVWKRSNTLFLLILLAIGVTGESLLALAQFVNHGSLGDIFYVVGERSFSAQTPGIAQASLDGNLVLRAYGTFPHPNVLAGYLVTLFPLFLSFLSTAGNNMLRRLLGGSAVVLASLALGVTLSRAAFATWIGIVALWIVFIRMHIWRARIRSIYIRLSILVVLGVFIIIAVSMFPRFATVLLGDESFVIRWQLLSISLQVFLSSPLFGIGLQNFIIHVTTFPSFHGNIAYLQPVHNIFVLLLIETGIFGLGFVLIFLAATYRRLFCMRPSFQTRAVALSLFCIMLLGMVDHYFITLQQGQLLSALVLGLAWQKEK